MFKKLWKWLDGKKTNIMATATGLAWLVIDTPKPIVWTDPHLMAKALLVLLGIGTVAAGRDAIRKSGPAAPGE